MFVERLQALADEQMAAKIAEIEPESWIQVEKQILLQTLDHHWKEHLAMLDALRQVIHLRAYAQKKPIDEYKHEAFPLFERMLVSIREDVTRRADARPGRSSRPPPPPVLPDFITQHLDPFTGDDDTADIDAGTGAILSRLPPLAISRSRRCRSERRRRRGRSAGQPQRAVPVRLGPEVQALPRAARVVGPARWGRSTAASSGAPTGLTRNESRNERIAEAQLSPAQWATRPRARTLVKGVRAHKPSGVDAFLQTYDLGSDEGVAMMCLAEALLRIPDAHTADELIADKLAGPDWSEKLGGRIRRSSTPRPSRCC